MKSVILYKLEKKPLYFFNTFIGNSVKTPPPVPLRMSSKFPALLDLSGQCAYFGRGILISSETVVSALQKGNDRDSGTSFAHYSHDLRQYFTWGMYHYWWAPYQKPFNKLVVDWISKSFYSTPSNNFRMIQCKIISWIVYLATDLVKWLFTAMHVQ
jgi:hypothetical protein